MTNKWHISHVTTNTEAQNTAVWVYILPCQIALAWQLTQLTDDAACIIIMQCAWISSTISFMSIFIELYPLAYWRQAHVWPLQSLEVSSGIATPAQLMRYIYIYVNWWIKDDSSKWIYILICVPGMQQNRVCSGVHIVGITYVKVICAARWLSKCTLISKQSGQP